MQFYTCFRYILTWLKRFTLLLWWNKQNTFIVFKQKMLPRTKTVSIRRLLFQYCARIVMHYIQTRAKQREATVCLKMLQWRCNEKFSFCFAGSWHLTKKNFKESIHCFVLLCAQHCILFRVSQSLFTFNLSLIVSFWTKLYVEKMLERMNFKVTVAEKFNKDNTSHYFLGKAENTWHTCHVNCRKMEWKLKKWIKLEENIEKNDKSKRRKLRSWRKIAARQCIFNAGSFGAKNVEFIIHAHRLRQFKCSMCSVCREVVLFLNSALRINIGNWGIWYTAWDRYHSHY